MDDRVWTALLLLIPVVNASAEQLPEGAVVRFRTAPGEPAFTGCIWTSFSPDGRTVAIADEAGRLDLWNLAGKRLRTLRTTGPKGGTPRWSPDGRRLYTGDSQGVAVWEIAGSAQPRVLSSGLTLTDGPGIAASADGKFVVATLPHSTLVCWDVETGRERWRCRYSGPIGVSADSRHVVRSYFGARHEFLDAATGNEAYSLGPPLIECVPTICENFALSPYGRHLAVNVRGSLSLRDARTGAELWSRTVVRRPATPLAFSRDGQWLATTEGMNILAILDADTGETLIEHASPGVEITSIDFTPNGRRVLTAFGDGTAVLRDLAPADPKPADAWRALSSPHGAAVYAAIWSLARDPNGPTMLRTKVPTVPRLDERDLGRLIADLDAPRHAVRERASRALSEQGRAAMPALRAASARGLSAEASARAEKLIQADRSGFTPQEIAHRRAVKAMSLAGTKEARELLLEWARGAPGAVLTEEAKAALDRLK